MKSDLITFPTIVDERGKLTFFEEINHIPIEIRRIFYIYDVPCGKDRGAHAHKLCHQILIALNGSLTVELDNGILKQSIILDSPNKGLHIFPGIWAAETSFQANTICLVLASHPYDESDYIRNYEEYLKYKGI